MLSAWNKMLPDRVKSKEREKLWVGNFHLMCSKDNDYVPKYRREFFDTPVVYDVNGSRT